MKPNIIKFREKGDQMPGILIKNGILFDETYSNAVKMDVLIVNRKIKEISKEIKNYNKDTKIVDVKENYILPGLIDCHTHLGIIEEGTGKIGIDNNETSEPVTPQMRAIDAINPMDMAFMDAVRSGITAVMSSPGSNNAVGGQNLVIKTYGILLDKMVVKNPLGLKISLGENAISTYGCKDKCPVTRMGTAALIRELFMRTQDYIVKKEQNKIEERNIKFEAVIPLLKGEIYLRAHAHRADDIMTAVRIAEEFNISKLVIEHGTEAHLVSEYLKEKEIPVAFGPMLTPRTKMELRQRNYGSIVRLFEAGLKVAIITDHPYNSIDQLRHVAILAVSEGLGKKDAINAITLHPAQILGLDNRIGSIKEGNDADLAIFNGYPMDIMSKVIMTLINGEIVYSTLQ